MKASLDWLQSYLADPLPKADDLAALLTEHVFEVEGVEGVGDDTVFDFKVLPDRAHHLLSHRGLAHEIGVLTKKTVKDEPPAAIPDGNAGTVAISIAQEGFCRRLVARRFSGITKKAADALTRTRLEAIGQRSINALVDVSNYVMFDVGQPSHVLDAKKVQGALVVRPAAAGERITVLDGREVELLDTDWVIADDAGPLEVAGIKGGSRAAVSEETTDIIVHCGNYDPVSIRRTATRLNLRSDASKRYENEIAPQLAERGLAQLSVRIAGLGDAVVAGPVTDVYPVARVMEPFTVTAQEVSAMLGTEVAVDEIMDLLTRMDCVVEQDGDSIRLTPPADRFDLRIPEDVADEVGRVRGYNGLQGVMPPALPEPQEQDPLFWYAEKAKEALVARGYSEVLLYALMPRGAFEIEYPLASDKAWLREDLGTTLAEKLVVNKRNADLLGLDAIKLCEVGQVFPASGERTSLALGVALTRARKEAPEDVIREDLHALSEALGIEVPNRTNTVPEGAVCEVDFTELVAKLPAPGTFADLKLPSMPEDATYRPIVPYPFVARDVAAFVPEGVTADQVHEAIVAHAGPLRVRSWLFDEFVKADEPPKHSVAFRIVFQSPERTLEDTEVNAIMEKIHAAFEKAGWQVR